MPARQSCRRKRPAPGGGTMSCPSLLSYPSGARHTRALGVWRAKVSTWRAVAARASVSLGSGGIGGIKNPS